MPWSSDETHDAEPTEQRPGAITALLARWSRGDEEAFRDLVTLAYEDLRAIAHRRLRTAGGERPLATTGLVHETFLKLDGHSGGEWASRAEFYAFVSKAMRHILVDFARRSLATKRGGGQQRVLINVETLPTPDETTEILGVDQALTQLAEWNTRMAQVVELRFFGGLTVAETAKALDTSARTVEREWTRARAYLLHALGGTSASTGGG